MENGSDVALECILQNIARTARARAHELEAGRVEGVYVGAEGILGW